MGNLIADPRINRQPTDIQRRSTAKMAGIKKVKYGKIMLYISIIMYILGKLMRRGVMGMSRAYYESFLGERQSIYFIKFDLP